DAHWPLRNRGPIYCQKRLPPLPSTITWQEPFVMQTVLESIAADRGFVVARARNIKPGFFKNEDLAACDPLARILFARLWTICDREGLLEDRPRRIKAEVLPYDDCDVNELLGQLASKGFITRYEAGGLKCLSIPTFVSHQRPHQKEPSHGLPPPPVCRNKSGKVPVRPRPVPARPDPEPNESRKVPAGPEQVRAEPVQDGTKPEEVPAKCASSLNPSSLNPSLLNPSVGAGAPIFAAA